MTPENAREQAIAKAGGSRSVAEALGITRQAVEDWIRVPAKHVLRLEAISGVSRYDLRPDIYGDPDRPLGSHEHVAA